MNGKPYIAGKFALSLRIRLFKEHLGYDITKKEIPQLLYDPLSDKLFDSMKEIASNNTKLYTQIFNTYPTDDLKTLKDCTKVIEESELNIDELKKNYNKNSKNIIGNIVDFPLNFLCNESIARGYFCREILVPIKNFL